MNSKYSGNDIYYRNENVMKVKLIKEMYVEEKLSVREIADEMGMSERNIKRILKDNCIHKRS